MNFWRQSFGHAKRLAARRANARHSVLTKIGDSSTLKLASSVVLLLGCTVLAAAVRAYNHGTLNGGLSTKPLTVAAIPQGNGTVSRSNLGRRLSLQPEADRSRRRLGQRFIAPGHERAAITGTLTVGAQQFQVRIVRTQSDDGEAVEIALNNGAASLTWNAGEGAKSGASLASGTERQLTERLALDSPDQFIQAQLRMASYYTIARNVLPAGAGDADDYNGPMWDVVRVTEPKGEDAGQPLSLVRHYFLNSSTGLLEKVVSDEPGQTIVAELLGWTNQGGELLPTHIVWTRDKQVVMELTVGGFLTGPKA
jgi:hypothetical protein